jgi:hypothetical protein
VRSASGPCEASVLPRGRFCQRCATEVQLRGTMSGVVENGFSLVAAECRLQPDPTATAPRSKRSPRRKRLPRLIPVFMAGVVCTPAYNHENAP